ncbi:MULTISPECIES: ParA family protein [Arcicella]|uniref:ParA family protein n=1 Tax=Arcicella lustrica TaxID=2984196 RepID=A0ABU5SKW6_9BACT|nr:ParA family protein [Arcicella sp. DC25W]MEA5427938.1 ParA family protein [Arcicella sp. DC25W]
MKTNLTLEKISNFFRHNPSLNVNGLNDEAGLPKRKLDLVFNSNGSRKLSEDDLLKLEPILKKYGYSEYLYQHARVISVVNHKGGVGKTTTTACLGESLVSKGFKVLLVDFDPQGNLSQILGVENPEVQVADCLFTNLPLPVVEILDNLWLAPSDISLAESEVDLLSKVGGDVRLKHKIEPLLESFDYVLIDCPPSLSKLTVSALNASNATLITMLPESSSLKGLNSLLNRISEVKTHTNRDLTLDGIVFTMVKKNTVHDGFKEAVRNSMKDSCRVFKTEIRHLIDFQKSQALQATLGTINSSSEAYKCYKDFCDEYVEYLQVINQ